MVKNIIYDNIMLLFIFIILPLTYSFFYSDYILLFGILLTSIPTYKVFFCKKNRKLLYLNKKIYNAFYFYIIWMLILIFNSKIEINTFIRIVQFMGCFFAFTCGLNIDLNNRKLLLTKIIINIILLLNVIVWFKRGMPFHNFSFIISNTDTYASIIYCWMMFLSLSLQKNKNNLFSIILCFFLITISSARGSILSALIFIIVFYFIFGIKRNKKLNTKLLNAILITTILLCFLFIILYAKSQYFSWAIALDNFSKQYFKKNFYSGRQIIWSNIIIFIQKKPLIGYGLTTLPSDLFLTRFSAHNTFLQLTLQSGIIGLILLFNIIIKIYKKLSKLQLSYSIAGIASILSIILHECFEACLIFNMLVAGLQMWFIMGIASNSNYKEVKNEK